jgi:transcriptional antiterminator RfaH
MSDQVQWFCVMSEPRRERVAEESLRAEGCDAYCPMLTSERIRNRRKVVGQEPLFPGYVFTTVSPEQSFYELRALDGISRFVSFDGKPSIMRSEAVEALRAAETLCQLSDERVKPLFAAGEPVRPVSMPYGPIGRILAARPNDRWLVAMRWFGVEREVTISACELEPA